MTPSPPGPVGFPFTPMGCRSVAPTPVWALGLQPLHAVSGRPSKVSPLGPDVPCGEAPSMGRSRVTVQETVGTALTPRGEGRGYFCEST